MTRFSVIVFTMSVHREETIEDDERKERKKERKKEKEINHDMYRLKPFKYLIMMSRAYSVVKP
jgi:hypothetical protein